jgi:hypothetical protein
MSAKVSTSLVAVPVCPQGEGFYSGIVNRPNTKSTEESAHPVEILVARLHRLVSARGAKGRWRCQPRAVGIAPAGSRRLVGAEIVTSPARRRRTWSDDLHVPRAAYPAAAHAWTGRRGRAPARPGPGSPPGDGHRLRAVIGGCALFFLLRPPPRQHKFKVIPQRKKTIVTVSVPGSPGVNRCCNHAGDAMAGPRGWRAPWMVRLAIGNRFLAVGFFA